jgi:hypothetical protein
LTLSILIEAMLDPAGMYETCVNGCKSVLSNTSALRAEPRISLLAATADVPKAIMAKGVAMK